MDAPSVSQISFWEELIEIENDSRKGFPYAPYVMYVIEKVTGICFRKDGEHHVLKIHRTKQPGASCTPSPSSTHSQSPPPAESPPRYFRGPSHSCGPSHSRGSFHSRGLSHSSSHGNPSLGRRVWEALFGMCKKHATDVYEMRKDINEIRSHLKLPPSDIGEPPVFEDPFAAYDVDVAAWYAAQESGAAVEEEAQ